MTCRWVSQFLSEVEKQDLMDSCLSMLKKFDGGRRKLMYNIITGDENCFYYYDL